MPAFLAVIDINLLVAAMISRPGSPSRKLLDAVRDGRLKLVLSRPLIDKFIEVMSRPKFARYGIAIGDVLDFISGLLEVASIVEITGAPRGCRDPDDDAVIEPAEIGAVDYVITGDKDLTTDIIRASLREFEIEVITAGDFLWRSLPLPALAALALEQARMIVAGEVGSAIAQSSWQIAVVRKIEIYMHTVAATLEQRTAAHKNELAELNSRDQSDPDTVSSLAVLETKIAKTNNFRKTVVESMVEMMKIMGEVASELRFARGRVAT